jgi:hypothetical protein
MFDVTDYDDVKSAGAAGTFATNCALFARTGSMRIDPDLDTIASLMAIEHAGSNAPDFNRVVSILRAGGYDTARQTLEDMFTAASCGTDILKSFVGDMAQDGRILVRDDWPEWARRISEDPQAVIGAAIVADSLTWVNGGEDFILTGSEAIASMFGPENRPEPATGRVFGPH